MTYTSPTASILAQKSSQIKSQIRTFFDSQGFLEVDTPIMTPHPGMEPYLTPFESTLTPPSTLENSAPIPVFLNHSPELQMKKLLALAPTDPAFEKIYNMGKVFRNGELDSKTHNPEFTMLEWYRYNSDYTEMMNDTEALIRHLTPTLTYQGQNIDLTAPFIRKSIKQLFLDYTKIDLEICNTFDTLKAQAEALGHSTDSATDWDEIFFIIFMNDIEPRLASLTQPIFLYDYPSSQAALAKKAKNPFFAERFELYIAGLEIANAYSELIDATEQKIRLKEEQLLRKKLNKTVFDIDEEFLNSLKSLRKPCSGIALGVDRLIMLLTDSKSIEEILLFPMVQMILTK